MRQGLKSDMDPNKLLPGELAVPLDSEEVYACFAPGKVQRLATHEAMKAQIIDATEDVVTDLTAGFTAGVNAATSAANTAASTASVATTNANTATSAANTAATRAEEAANEAELILAGDLSNKTVAFTQAATRVNIATGESFATLLGKIKKWFADLNTGAFAAIANNLTTTATGSVLDATQGKALNDTKANNTTSFTQASARTNIASGETLPVVLGKIMKWFTDLKDAAFSTVSNLLTVTTAGYVLDARQGKILNDAIVALGKEYVKVDTNNEYYKHADGRLEVLMSVPYATDISTVFGGGYVSTAPGIVTPAYPIAFVDYPRVFMELEATTVNATKFTFNEARSKTKPQNVQLIRYTAATGATGFVHIKAEGHWK